MINVDGNNILKININKIFVVLLPVIAAYSRNFIEILSISNENKLNMQYGNGIFIDLVSIWVLGFIFIIISKGIKKSEISSKSGFGLLLIISAITMVFPNNQNNLLSLFGLVKIFKYFLIAILLTSIGDFNKFYSWIKKGFKIGLIIQTIVGFLFTFGGIIIPFITGTSSHSIRNGFYRMFGTMESPGDFSLYMIIILAFFLVDFWILKERRSLVYMVLSWINLYFSGARAMTILSAIIIVGIIFYRYRKNYIVKAITIIGAIAGIIFFINSDYYYEYFVRNNIFDMLSTRMVHWNLGIRLFLKNFIFGVGLNNITYFIFNNFDQVFSNVNYQNILVDSMFLQTAPIHNSFFIVACEMGVLGIIAYLRIYVIAFKKCISVIKNENKEFSKFAVFPLVALGTYIVYGLQGWAMLKQPFWIIFCIIICYVQLLFKNSNNNEINNKLEQRELIWKE
ncbi:O-antigen ligase family protein [Clostridium sp. AL.422]|uniref:O-antigen ligase family protein n=1 Tax=Clostridium TaxID=1485 RepID=UPI00293DB5AB|nr:MULTISPECIES: O-antigen ligase family protein [unclassified Clostridium]MDV4150304.1 O-antigen ligase family protein [Clostridium sp. AL.422]